MPRQLFLYHHTHWDREWYWPFRQYQFRLAQVIDDLLDQLERGQLPCFTLDGQTALIDDYLELRPDNRDRLANAIQQGKILVGPWFVMPDEFLVSGESLIRNLALGIEQSKALGCNQFTGYLPDTFGHSAHIPTLLQGFGITTAMVWRGVHPKTNEFMWQSPNGDRVLAYHLSNGYFQNTVHDPNLTPNEKKSALTDWMTQGFGKSAQGDYLLPIGGDHLGLLDAEGHQWLADWLAPIKKEQKITVETTTTVGYMAALAKTVKPKTLPLITGELLDNTSAFVLPGVWSARLSLKKANRIAEHTLTHQLEPLLAMGLLANSPLNLSSAGIERAVAWKTLLLNHPHDSICGCSVDSVHRANEARFDEVMALTHSLVQHQQHTLINHHYPHLDHHHWAVFYTGDRPYTGVIPVRSTGKTKADAVKGLTQIAGTRTILLDRYETNLQEVPQAHLTQQAANGWTFVKDLPPHSISVISKTPCESYTPVTVNHTKAKTIMDNGLITVTITPKTGIAVEHHKHAYPIGHHLVDWQDVGDSYNSGPVAGDNGKQAVLNSIAVIHNGPLIAQALLTYTLDDMTLYTTVQVSAASNTIEFDTRFENTQPNHKLQVGFNTGNLLNTVWTESHLGMVTRSYDPHYHEKHHMPAGRFAELKTNTGPIQRFVMANNQLWITEGLTEYEVRGEVLALTLHRAFSHLSKGDTGVRGAQAGPPFETPEGQGLNRQFQYRYAWTPLPTEPDHVATAYHQAQLFYGTIATVPGNAPAKKAGAVPTNAPLATISWDNPHLVRHALKPLDNGKPGVVLRLTNVTPHSQQATLFIKPSSQKKALTHWATLTLAETVIEALPPEKPITWQPGETKTLGFW